MYLRCFERSTAEISTLASYLVTNKVRGQHCLSCTAVPPHLKCCPGCLLPPVIGCCRNLLQVSRCELLMLILSMRVSTHAMGLFLMQSTNMSRKLALSADKETLATACKLCGVVCGRVLQAQYFRTIICKGNQYSSTILVKHPGLRTDLRSGMPWH
jgi:hypothetical protein